jgi:hypothetical protein
LFIFNANNVKMIRTKDSSVNVTDLHPKMKALVEDLSNRFDGIVVTSGKDSKHSVFNSRHYTGKAIDFGAGSSDKKAYQDLKNYVLEGRTKWHLPSKFAEYEVEDILDENNHIHIELVQTPSEVVKAIVADKKVSFALIGLIVVSIGAFIYYKKNIKR